MRQSQSVVTLYTAQHSALAMNANYKIAKEKARGAGSMRNVTFGIHLR